MSLQSLVPIFKVAIVNSLNRWSIPGNHTDSASSGSYTGSKRKMSVLYDTCLISYVVGVVPDPHAFPRGIIYALHWSLICKIADSVALRSDSPYMISDKCRTLCSIYVHVYC